MINIILYNIIDRTLILGKSSSTGDSYWHKQKWTYYIRLDIKLRAYMLFKLTLKNVKREKELHHYLKIILPFI